mgnify:CR=1 FL=1
MKFEIIPTHAKPLYPYLGIHKCYVNNAPGDALVVMFTSPGEGVVVQQCIGTTAIPLGTRISALDPQYWEQVRLEEYYVPYKGIVRLCN